MHTCLIFRPRFAQTRSGGLQSKKKPGHFRVFFVPVRCTVAYLCFFNHLCRVYISAIYRLFRSRLFFYLRKVYLHLQWSTTQTVYLAVKPCKSVNPVDMIYCGNVPLNKRSIVSQPSVCISRQGRIDLSAFRQPRPLATELLSPTTDKRTLTCACTDRITHHTADYCRVLS